MSDDSDPPPSKNPPRLARGDDELAKLLSRSHSEFRRGLDEPGAFRRTARVRRRRVLLSYGFGATAALALSALLLRALDRPRDADRFALRPEPIAASARELVPELAPTPPTQEPAVAPLPKAERAPAEPADPLDAPVTEARCRAWSADGKSERAVECYRSLGRGGGVGAEVGLYHAARISLEGLKDPGRALALVDEHERRFPSSSLSGEVAWLRVQSLNAGGHFEEALAASEALLVSPAGRALAGELHWLRARIYQDERGDCGRAVSELVSLVGEATARGDDAELRRARCFEKLGRSTDARTAYQRYLERADARHATEARAPVGARGVTERVRNQLGEGRNG